MEYAHLPSWDLNKTDEVEPHNHLDPGDAAGDLDHDGLTNLFEYEHNLSIQDADTDHDGINDGDELQYWNATRGLDMDTVMSYPLNPDVYGDNIPTTAVAIGVIFWQYHKAKVSLSLKVFGKGDLAGIILSILGLFITGVLISYGHGFWSAAVGFVLSLIGLIIALASPSPVDRVNPSIGYIGELIDASIVGISAEELVASF